MKILKFEIEKDTATLSELYNKPWYIRCYNITVQDYDIC